VYTVHIYVSVSEMRNELNKYYFYSLTRKDNKDTPAQL
jgi:hypothetical protein